MEKKGFFEGSPNGIFAFGLVAGIALALLFSSMSGAAPSAKKGGDNAPGGTVVDDTIPDDGGSAVVLAPVTDDDHIRGDLDKAKVILVEYSDFECPFCSRHHPTLVQIVEDYGDDVAWVYRHLPLSFHPEATPAALASECAADQGKFWEYSDALFENQTNLGSALYSQLAADLGLNTNKFENCLENQDHATDVAEDLASAQAAGASGTPATFVNGQLISGAVPYSNFSQIIDSLLAE